MNDLGKAFIEFRNKYWNICEDHITCEKCPLHSWDGECNLTELSDEHIEIIENYVKPVTRNTPRDTLVFVRDYDNEAWREAYLCAKLKDTVIVYTNTEDGKYTMCKSDKANSVRRFNQCELR